MDFLTGLSEVIQEAEEKEVEKLIKKEKKKSKKEKKEKTGKRKDAPSTPPDTTNKKTKKQVHWPPESEIRQEAPPQTETVLTPTQPPKKDVTIWVNNVGEVPASDLDNMQQLLSAATNIQEQETLRKVDVSRRFMKLHSLIVTIPTYYVHRGQYGTGV